MSTITRWNRGDKFEVTDPLVNPSWHGIYTVDKVNQKNLASIRDATGHRVNVPKQYATPLDPDRAPDEPTDHLPALHKGNLVTMSSTDLKDVVFVVTALGSAADDTYQVARLGGDNGRYYRSIPRSMLTLVDADRITVAAE